VTLPLQVTHIVIGFGYPNPNPPLPPGNLFRLGKVDFQVESEFFMLDQTGLQLGFSQKQFKTILAAPVVVRKRRDSGHKGERFGIGSLHMRLCMIRIMSIFILRMLP
jgi:hypothetical protein